jgi:hypothetical protein
MQRPPTAVVRQWAKARGLTVGDRGRLAPQLFEAYAAEVEASANVETAAVVSERPQAPPTGTPRPPGTKPAAARTVRARTPWNWPQLDVDS